MTARAGTISRALIAISVGGALAISLVMDGILALREEPTPLEIVASAVLFNAAAVLMAVVGSTIEWRRPGHRIGHLLMVAGPLYALLAAMWLTISSVEVLIGPSATAVLGWAGAILSYAGVALIAGGIPLLFPTGTLPGPRWRTPVSAVVGLFVAGLAAWATRPGPMAGTTTANPFGVAGWPPVLQILIDLIWFDLLGMLALGVAGLSVRYRRGDRVERLQVRWLAASVAVCLVGFALTLVEMTVRAGSGPLASTLIAYLGILAMPVSIGIAVTRYRLYEIDRLISRTIGWALVTGVLVAVFAGLVVGLQALLAGVTQGQTLAVAASTLAAFALFQPVRRRIQSAVDRRFDRARYDADRTAAAFAERLRDLADLAELETDVARTVGSALRPRSTGIWVRERRPEGAG